MRYKFIPVNNDINKAKAFANSLDQNFIINTQCIKQKPHYVPSMEVIETLHKDGWIIEGVSEERQKSTRKITNHYINLQHPDLKILNNKGNTEAIASIIMSNSCSGISPLNVDFGLFRLICSNGLVQKAPYGKAIQFKHNGEKTFDEKIFITDINDRMFSIMNDFEVLKAKRLTTDQMLELAKRAAKLKYKDLEDIDISSLLVNHRDEDKGDDLWSVFNTIQENLTHDIASPSFDLKVNQNLMELVGTYV